MPRIHILSHIKVCGVRYSHAIVIEAALYLYRKLAQNKSIKLPEGEVNIPVFGFAPADVFSSDQDWLRFDGGLALSPWRRGAIRVTQSQGPEAIPRILTGLAGSRMTQRAVFLLATD